MAFTHEMRPRVESFLAREIGAISGDLARAVGDTSSLCLLVGGFGRGEGAVIEEDDGSLTIVNDIDIEILLSPPSPLQFSRRNKQLRETIQRVVKATEARLQLKQLDIGVRYVPLLKMAPPSIAYYELLNAHQTLFGEPKLLAGLEMRAHELPPIEGTKLLLNRGGGLLIAEQYLEKRRDLTSAEVRNFAVELQKAVIAAGDAVLLSMGEYHFSYAERAKRFSSLSIDSFRNDLAQLYMQATEARLQPRRAYYSAAPSRERYETVVTTFERVFRWYEEQRLGRSITTWLQYSKLHRGGAYGVRRRALEIGRAATTPGLRSPMTLFQGKELSLLGALPLILFESTPSATKRAASLVCSAAEDRQSVIRDFLRCWHPSGEALRVMEAA